MVSIIIFGIVILIAMYAFYSVVRTIWKKRETITAIKEDKNWYKKPFLSREHFVSEAFLFLSATFFIGFFEVIWSQYPSFIAIDESWIYIVGGVGITVIGYYLRSMLLSFYGIYWFFGGYFYLMSRYTLPANIKDVITLSLIFIFLPLIYNIGQIHYKQKSWKRYGFYYKLISLIAVIGWLFALSFEDFLFSLEQMIQGAGLLSSIPVFVMFLLILLGSLFSIVYAFYKKSSGLTETIVSFFFVLLGILLLFFPENLELYEVGRVNAFGFVTGPSTLTTTGYIIAAGFNALLFMFLLGLIGLGYKKHEIWEINIGIIGLFIFIIIKYFDWFFSFMEKSLFFVTAGIIVLAIGFFMEKGRRYMIASLDDDK